MMKQASVKLGSVKSENAFESPKARTHLIPGAPDQENVCCGSVRGRRAGRRGAAGDSAGDQQEALYAHVS